MQMPHSHIHSVAEVFLIKYNTVIRIYSAWYKTCIYVRSYQVMCGKAETSSVAYLMHPLTTIL